MVVIINTFWAQNVVGGDVLFEYKDMMHFLPADNLLFYNSLIFESMNLSVLSGLL